MRYPRHQALNSARVQESVTEASGGVQSVWNIYDEPFHDLLDAVNQSGEDITKGLNAILHIIS